MGTVIVINIWQSGPPSNSGDKKQIRNAKKAFERKQKVDDKTHVGQVSENRKSSGESQLFRDQTVYELCELSQG